jgi:hypothetical protein
MRRGRFVLLFAISTIAVAAACGGAPASEATPASTTVGGQRAAPTAAAASGQPASGSSTSSAPPTTEPPPGPSGDNAAGVGVQAPASQPVVAAEAPAAGGTSSSVSTKAVEIRVEGVTMAPQIGARQARAGYEFVVVDTSWKNLIPLTPVDKNASSSPVGGLGGFGTSKRPPPDSKNIEMKPTPYVVPMLRKQFWVFTDERYADTVDLAAQAATEGAFPSSGFGIAKLGDVTRGKLVFEVPAGSHYRVFQFYDINHGHASFVIAGARPAAPPSLGSARQNDIMQLSLADAGFSAESAPRPGLKYFTVALRGRSLSPANIVDLQPHHFIYLQTDRGCVAKPERNPPGLTRPMADVGSLPPTSPNEEQLAFLVPEDTRHARLLVTPAGKSAIALPSIESFALSWPSPQQSIQDGSTLKLHVLPTPPRPASLPAASPGRELVMLDVVIENQKATQGIDFQGTMQLRLMDPSGAFIQPSPLSNQLTCTLGDEGVIPASHARRFRYVYDVPAGMPLKLEYRGFEKDTTVVEIKR